MMPRNLETNNNRPMWVFRILWLVLIAAVAICGFIYRDQVSEAASVFFALEDEDPVPVLELAKREFQLDVPAFGEVTGLETTGVPTPSIRSGSLKIAWLIPEGSFVSAGDVLVRFDATEARLNLETERAQLQSTDRRLDLKTSQHATDETVLGIDKTDAEMEYDYAVNVMPEDEDIFSKWEIIEAQINAGLAQERIEFISQKLRVNKRSARADLQILTIDKNKALAEIDIAQQTLNSLELRAPKDGLVLYRRDHMREPQVGDETWRGQTLVELVDLSLLQARLHILEVDAGQVVKGQEVIVRLDAIPERDFHGTVKSIAALAQPLERNSPLKYFECDVLISDVGQDLQKIKPGMDLKAKIVLDQYASVFVVPNSAVSIKEGKVWAYVLENKVFVPKEVEVGSRNHGQTVVLDGLAEGQLLAMRNPYETRKAYLPDFSKAGTQGERRMMMRGGRGGDIRIMIH